MDFFNVLKERHSIRVFKEQPLGAEDLRRILEAINMAPSAGNLQAYEVYLVSEAEHRTALAKGTNNVEILRQAAVVLVFCTHVRRSEAEYGKRGAELYCLQDATIACTFAMLAATALGLSSVWVGAFHEENVRDVIHAPADQQPVALLPIGYAAGSPGGASRRSLNELVHAVE